MGKIGKIICLLVIALSACFHKEEKRFYCDPMADTDVWRLPIVEPYEFVSIDTSSGWTLSWPPMQNKAFLFNYTADSINYQKELIFCFSKTGTFDLHLIDLKNEKVISFQSRAEFKEFTRKNNLSDKMYSTQAVFSIWKSTKILPWSRELPKYDYCK